MKDELLKPLLNVEQAVGGEFQEKGLFANFWASIFNIANAILGSGILGLAYAAKESGLVPFGSLLIIMALVTDFSLSLLVRICDKYGFTSFEEVGKAAYGVKGLRLSSFAIMLQNMGATISYTVIIGDLLPRFIKNVLRHSSRDYLFSDDSQIERALLMTLVTVVVVMPLAVQKKIGFLGFMSVVSISMMVLFAALVFIKRTSVPCPISHDDVCSADMFVFSADSVLVLPTIGFSFICHTTLLPVYHELKARSFSRMQRVTRAAIFICFILYGTSGVFGYLTFFDQTESDIMKSYLDYDENNTVIKVVQVCFIIAVTLTIPLICFPFRKTVMLGILQKKTLTNPQHYGITIATNLIVLTVSILIPKIKIVFGFFGATSAVLLMFLLPSMFYRKLMGGSKFFRGMLIVMFICGLSISVTALVGQTISVFG
eukprot:TRINITY_DN68611_c0_g1_i1.p1 TRINITY_DN68611_c0_g1~~TRINITY_DN68611_c0_g1_i1.p1  ORF type:complete len:429 (+),score=93.77 TRINITY_DN68611_c0_g1_i1:152-1438(+)